MQLPKNIAAKIPPEVVAKIEAWAAKEIAALVKKIATSVKSHVSSHAPTAS